MTTHSQRHQSRTLPFRYQDTGIDFEIESYSVDRQDPTELTLLSSQREVDITPELDTDDDGAPEWDSLTIYGTLTVNEGTIEDILPRKERESPPARLYVAVRCHETILREKALTNESFDGPGEYSIDIELPKDRIRGTVELHPYLVRTEDGVDGEAYASKKNVRLASGQSYRIVVDRPEDEELPSIDGEEVSFAQASHLPDGNKLYYLDFRNERRPKLWINADHSRITDVLQANGSVGAEPRMRDVVLDQISYGIWIQLFLRAATSIDVDGEVEYDWQRTVIDTFAPNLYDIDDTEEAVHKLRDELKDTDQLPHFISRLDGELQEFIDPRTQLINLMEEGLQI